MGKENASQSEPQVLREISFPQEFHLVKLPSGKVRERYLMPDNKLLLVTTDRLSAFDRQVGLIPDRGHVLNRVSQWWFERTKDIVPNHLLSVPDPNVMLVKKLPRVDLEIVVRGFNTGSTATSIWKRYKSGQREFGGVTLPGGMRKNESLPRPIIDPTSKAVRGHDQILTREEIIDSEIVTEEEYDLLASMSLALFERGQKLSQEVGLMLVDTKYEFAKDPEPGTFVLIDEIHTPDSSRFWDPLTYEQRLREGKDPEMYDKELIRLWFASQGYVGEGEPPLIPREVINEARSRYITVYEKLWCNKFIVPWGDQAQRIIKNVGYCLKNNPNG